MKKVAFIIQDLGSLAIIILAHIGSSLQPTCKAGSQHCFMFCVLRSKVLLIHNPPEDCAYSLLSHLLCSTYSLTDEFVVLYLPLEVYTKVGCKPISKPSSFFITPPQIISNRPSKEELCLANRKSPNCPLSVQSVIGYRYSFFE